MCTGCVNMCEYVYNLKVMPIFLVILFSNKKIKKGIAYTFIALGNAFCCLFIIHLSPPFFLAKLVVQVFIPQLQNPCTLGETLPTETPSLTCLRLMLSALPVFGSGLAMWFIWRSIKCRKNFHEVLGKSWIWSSERTSVCQPPCYSWRWSLELPQLSYYLPEDTPSPCRARPGQKIGREVGPNSLE